MASSASLGDLRISARRIQLPHAGHFMQHHVSGIYNLRSGTFVDSWGPSRDARGLSDSRTNADAGYCKLTRVGNRLLLSIAIVVHREDIATVKTLVCEKIESNRRHLSCRVLLFGKGNDR